MQHLVKEFHEKYGHHICDRPSFTLDPAIVKLRMQLILEEHVETMEAMNEYVKEVREHGTARAETLMEVADGLADLTYVILGTAVSLGLPLEELVAEVHRSNMTKALVRINPGQKYGTGGGKGPDYQPPDLKSILYGKSAAGR
jgi:predicted HAD superfamily Cof-like phosphohydrolase